jgi:hypothetical protein
VFLPNKRVNGTALGLGDTPVCVYTCESSSRLAFFMVKYEWKWWDCPFSTIISQKKTEEISHEYAGLELSMVLYITRITWISSNVNWDLWRPGIWVICMFSLEFSYKILPPKWDRILELIYGSCFHWHHMSSIFLLHCHIIYIVTTARPFLNQLLLFTAS